MKIFIVEDEPEIRLELKALLENALYQTQTTESFESLADQILEAEPDLVLLDWNLPGPFFCPCYFSHQPDRRYG